MKHIFAAIALAAGVSSAQSFIRTHSIVSDNSTFPTPANVEWMQGESVRFEITAKTGNFYIGISNGAAPVLKMWSGSVITQLYAQKTGTIYQAGSGKLYVDLLANEANISPSGAYNYAVGVYDGTQYMGVVAQGRATVRAHPFGASVGYVGAFNAFPYVPTNDAAYLGGITGAVAGANVSIARTGRTVYISSTGGGGGGSGTFTNVTVGTNVMTAQAIIQGGSNITTRAAGGTNYLDGATFSTLYTLQNGGGLSISQASGPTAILTVTNSTHLGGVAAASYATGTPLYVQSETNASARLASNVWAAADSTTNYVRRTGDTMSGELVGTRFERTSLNNITTVIGEENGAQFIGALHDTGSHSVGLSFVANPGLNVPIIRVGGFGAGGSYYGPGFRLSALATLEGAIADGDYGALEYVGGDNATQRLFSIFADAGGATAASAKLVLTNASFAGDGGRITNLPIYVNGGTVAQTATGTVITVTGGGGASLPAQTAPFALECQHVADAHGTNLTAFYSSGADALLSLSTVSATNAVNFAGVANQSTATLVTPSFVVWTVKIPELATNFTRLRWRAIDNQATASQPTFTLSWNNGASFAVMTSVVSAASTSTSNGYTIAGWTNGFQGRTVQIIGSFTAASTNNLNTRFQGVEASQQSPLWSVE